MSLVPKAVPGSTSSDEDQAEENVELVKSNLSENVDEPTLVGNFFFSF